MRRRDSALRCCDRRQSAFEASTAERVECSRLTDGGVRMAGYRCYFLDTDDSIFRAEIIEADSDHAALRNAQEILRSRPSCDAIEIWHLTRRVCKIPTSK